MSTPPRIKSTSRVIRWAITLAVVALVVWFAARPLADGWRELAGSRLVVRWPWLVAAAAIYLVALVPMALYWRRVLLQFGQSTSLARVARAYFLGHLGKYVPGKALVVVLRTAAVAEGAASRRAVVVSVFMETLTFMATGAAIAAVLLPTTGIVQGMVFWLAILLALVAGVPVVPPVARVLAAKVAGPGAGDEQGPNWPRAIDWPLVGWGVLAATLAWLGISASLWAVGQALVGDGATRAAAPWYVWVESATLPTVAGFLSLLPGGLGVRDVLVAGLLDKHLGAGMALAVATVWRAVSLLAELAICAILELALPRPQNSPPGHHTA
jgi:uncharacterized membrane protein YbhN (UPF0104 family)